MNNKGFSLIETVIVCISIILILMLCYYPYKGIVDDYYNKKNYNTIESIYKLNNIRNYLYKYGDVNKLIDKKGSNSIVSIKNLNFGDSDINNDYTNLLNILGIEYIYLSNYNNITYNNIPEMSIYIDTLNNEKLDYQNTFRIIAKFKDKSFANIKLWRTT